MNKEAKAKDGLSIIVIEDSLGDFILIEDYLYDKFNIKDLSIVIVSSSTDESDIVKDKSYDIVKQFIHKPIDLNTIKGLLS